MSFRFFSFVQPESVNLGIYFLLRGTSEKFRVDVFICSVSPVGLSDGFRINTLVRDSCVSFPSDEYALLELSRSSSVVNVVSVFSTLSRLGLSIVQSYSVILSPYELFRVSYLSQNLDSLSTSAIRSRQLLDASSSVDLPPVVTGESLVYELEDTFGNLFDFVSTLPMGLRSQYLKFMLSFPFFKGVHKSLRPEGVGTSVKSLQYLALLVSEHFSLDSIPSQKLSVRGG